SRWFRDYLFLPLEIATRDAPNRVMQAGINMMFTMLLCGLWHGASWNFVIFGGIHGAGLAAHIVWTKWKGRAALKQWPLYQFLWGLLSHFLTLGVILSGFIFFRTQSLEDAIAYLGRLLSWSHS